MLILRVGVKCVPKCFETKQGKIQFLRLTRWRPSEAKEEMDRFSSVTPV